jgi:dUTP pyrophosphatase
MESLKYYKIYQDAKDPFFATKNSACFDLSAYLPPTIPVKIYTRDNTPIHREPFCGESAAGEESFVLLNPGERALIPTGLILDIPTGYSVRLHVRSSLALKQGVTLANSEGVIDSDYVEPTFVMLYNSSTSTIHILNGDRICQGELVSMMDYTLDRIYAKPGVKTDRVGGFGSTGK